MEPRFKIIFWREIQSWPLDGNFMPIFYRNYFAKNLRNHFFFSNPLRTSHFLHVIADYSNNNAISCTLPPSISFCSFFQVAKQTKKIFLGVGGAQHFLVYQNYLPSILVHDDESFSSLRRMTDFPMKLEFQCKQFLYR